MEVVKSGIQIPRVKLGNQGLEVGKNLVVSDAKTKFLRGHAEYFAVHVQPPCKRGS